MMVVATPALPLTRADRVLDVLRTELDARRQQIDAPIGQLKVLTCTVYFDDAGMPTYVEFQSREKREIRRQRPEPSRLT
jgi:hypothetical protein